MSYLTQFQLAGPFGLFRDPEVPSNDYSSPLPSPSAVIGFVCNCMGFNWGPDRRGKANNDNPMPFSPELIEWVKKAKPSVAIGVKKAKLKGLLFNRQNISGNRFKDVWGGNDSATGQPIRMALFEPEYQIVIEVESEEENVKLRQYLNDPIRRGYLGNAKMPALVSKIGDYCKDDSIVWASLSNKRNSMATPAFAISLNQKSRLQFIGYLGFADVGAKNTDEDFAIVETETADKISFISAWKD